MSDKKRLFGTFGVRRTANDVLTPEFASRLAACYGTQIKGTVAVGGDTRTTTPMLMQAVIAGLLSSGCDVVDLGILPTPGVQYAVRKYYDGGVMITASHNPPKYNGIKFLDKDGIGIPDEMDLAIEKLYFDGEPDRVEFSQIGQIYKNDKIIEEYIDEAVSKVDTEAIKNANLKVVVDCGSGAEVGNFIVIEHDYNDGHRWTGYIHLKDIQQAGKKAMKIEEFLRGFRFERCWKAEF